MAKQISQETFDSVVRENIEEFDMSPQEAVEEAVSQFEAQEVNLGTIVQDLSLYNNQNGAGGDVGQHPVVIAIESLQTALKSQPASPASIASACDKIKVETDIDLAHKCLAGTNNAYPTLLAALEHCQDSAAMQSVLSALCSLCNGQPDLLDDKGRELVLSLLKSSSSDPAITRLLVRFITNTCVKHEANRQAYVKDELIQLLVDILDKNKDNKDIVKEACYSLRVLTFDDDIRAPFGKSHDHAKLIVTEAGALEKIMVICKDYIEDRAVLGELFSTLGRLAVRNEFCQQIMDLGGLQLMLQTLEKNIDHQNITKQVLGVLKAIAGNDAVKVAIVNHGGMNLLLVAMTKHARNPGICEIGCGALGTVVLRNPAHCKHVMSLGAAEPLIKVLQIHKDISSVTKQACMAVRNVVARTREYCDAFLELGVEPLILHVYHTHKDCHDEAKAALRDLGCKVELKELWKGEGKGIQH